MANALEMRVRRDDLRAITAARVDREPREGEALFRIDRFALTANNATYAAHGEDMRYWDFYPAPAGDGVVPVWGFATVVVSRVDGIAVGERFYGYWPMASHAVLRPERIGERGFVDGSPNRAELAAVYNSYVRTGASRDFGDERAYALFRPLYATSFLLDDRLSEACDIEMVVLSSASSKTAIGLAHALRSRGVPAVGLTSSRNRGFVERTGYYDRVLAYDEVGGLAPVSAAFVDFAGDDRLRAAVHDRFAERLLLSLVVGDTHWDAPTMRGHLPGPRPEFFFAPTQAAKRSVEWGAAGLENRMDEGWRSFLSSTEAWLEIREGSGDGMLAEAWRAIVDGRADPSVGDVLSL